MGVYLEYAAYFPSRSGSEVAYLEQAYPRPKFFFPVIFAVQSVILSFSSSNAIGKWEYIIRGLEILTCHSTGPVSLCDQWQ